jgi:wobble nucleotide-excising tRNase
VLESSSDVSQSVLTLLNEANGSLAKHNSLIRNRGSEQTKLKSEVWRFLLDDSLKPALESFEMKRSDCEAGIQSLREQIDRLEDDKKVATAELGKLEKQVTSVEPTVRQMNDYLASCDFTGFKLSTAEQNGFYQLIRDDGSLVNDSLSEGERSFVAFLYFYHLLQGSQSEIGTVGNRIAIFDDPVSSLDSNVLFAVSSLIRELYEPILKDRGALKQLIVLTHNVYFHKEVTCHPPKKAGMKFWVVKKRHGKSSIEAKAKNPVSSSYELLWQELHDSNLSHVTVQNTMRRILEQYFRMNGNLDVSKLDGDFTGKDRQLFRSLFSWVNAGSHDVVDDLYASSDDFTIEHYQDVFRKVFEQTNHIGHYDMMMKRMD